MRIGVVGKPNVGKSTFFSAATLAKVDIANYPFCTIDPNVGVSFIPARNSCPCKNLRDRLEADGRLKPTGNKDSRKGSICNPRTGYCIGFRRYVPCHLVDVAGLVPGASEGRGRGNAFLNDLANCNALIQVIDAAGSTDIEGNPLDITGNPVESMQAEIDFLVTEIDNWVGGILEEGWSRGARRIQAESNQNALKSFLIERLSGLGISSVAISKALEAMRSEFGSLDKPWLWENDKLRRLASLLRQYSFPIHLAANKVDLVTTTPWQSIRREGNLTPIMADMELALRRADDSDLINYIPGDTCFEINETDRLTDSQRKALANMSNILVEKNGTGVSDVLETVVFDTLSQIVVYPVQDENNWVDGDERILPDAFIVPAEIQAKDLAYQVHTELGEGFIRGTDARTRRTIGADHKLEDNAVIKIHSK